MAGSLPERVVARQRRDEAMQILSTRGLPTPRDENWKYPNLRLLDRVRFAPLDAAAGRKASAAGPQAPAAVSADLPAPLGGYARYTFVDGLFVPGLSAGPSPAGISVEPLAGPPSQQTGHAIRLPSAALLRSAPDLRFALLNEAFAPDGISIRVAAHTDCPGCIELVFVASSDAQAAASYPRIELQVAAGARVGLVERHVSAGSDSSFVNSVVSIDIGADAVVNHYRVQQLAAKALWFDTVAATLQRGSTYNLRSVNHGAASARSTIHVQLNGEHAAAGIYNASIGDRYQIEDTYALVEHAAPNTRSEQTFRGISADNARVAFNGKVVVRKEAQGTDSKQSLRGLLAGAEAEIDVRPQLEIYTDDVRCSHGATAGKLDENMLFYLLSRGLEPATAQRLLKWAFLEDVVAKIEVPELRRQIEQSLAGRLQDAAELKELL